MTQPQPQNSDHSRLAARGTPLDAIVVGAGLGGLATAVRLAASGARIVVLEQDAQPGGKLNQWRAGGFTFDTGPSLVTMPGVIADLFQAAGRRMGDYLTLQPLHPLCRYRYADGTTFDADSDLAAMTAAIRRLDPRDVGGYLRFLAYGRALYERAARPFLFHERPRPIDLLRRRGWDVLRIGAFRTMDRAVRAHFHSPYLRQLFNRYATYNGSSPYLAPATLCLIPYLEFAEGGWTIAGGLYRLAEALVGLAGELGVTIRTGARVETVLFEGRRAVGVRLADGQEYRAGTVVVNADPLYAYQALVPPALRPRHEPAARATLASDLSCSGFVLLLGTDCDFPALAHHNIFFSGDYPAEFRALFTERRPAPDPTIYVCLSSRTDPTQAPPGGGNLFVLVNAPALTPAADWAAWAGPYRARILDRLEAAGLSDLRRHIVVERILTPADFAGRFNAFGGALYGFSSNHRQAAFRRPANRAPGLPGLFFVGGSAHPGGGIPLALLSARLVVGAVMRNA
jgi:phytoene desaturase